MFRREEMSQMQQTNDSFIGRLLEEISWEGALVKGYREGGRGRENVLVAEVWQALHYLPREAFLGEVLKRTSNAQGQVLRLDTESARLGLLPDEISISDGVGVQADVHISTDEALVLVEAKRIRSSQFQQFQLARELMAVEQAARGKRPVLLLVLSTAPPIKVSGTPGRITIDEAIRTALLQITNPREAARLSDLIAETVYWTTWDDIAAATERGLSRIDGDASARASITRLAHDLLRSIEWHR